MENMVQDFPLCQEYNVELFCEVSHHMLIMQNAADKLEVPLEELIEFFYKGKIKLDTIREQEEVLRKHGGQKYDIL